jgi:trinucleotide repeat-containing gene 6 protein
LSGVGAVSTNIPKKDEWSGSGVSTNAASNWDPRGPSGTGPVDIRNMDPRDPRQPDMRMMENREQIQGNLRGVTGRLNGSTDMWQHGNMQGMPGMNKIVNPNASTGGNSNNPQWPGSQIGPKDIDKPGGWDSSPTAARRPIGGTNFDDGTSLWGQNRVPGVESSWKGDPMGRNNFGRNPIGAVPPAGLPPNRLPNKPEGNLCKILEMKIIYIKLLQLFRQCLEYIAFWS